jgi:hypothetical protein
MRKFFVILITLSLLLLGCNSTNSTALTEFDNSQLKEKIKDAKFQPKLPTKLPFEVSNAEFNPPPNSGDTLIFDFTSEGEDNNNHLGLKIVKGKIISTDNKGEKVEIGDNDGRYAENDADTQTLTWQEEEISYSLTYFGNQSDKEISKEELIKTAESFKK